MIKDHKKPQLITSGERLKYLRSLLRMSRSYLQEKYGLPEVTLKSWENATTTITKAGVRRCVEIYTKEGVNVNEDWILKGVGRAPVLTNLINEYWSECFTQNISTDDDEISMMRDANAFKEMSPNAVVMIVSNDDMRPFYRPGDYIGGKMRHKDLIETAVNKDCIIFLSNGGRFFRRIIKNNLGNYNLTCLNPNENTSEPVLYNVEIESVAPVIWHRWKDD